MRESSPNCVLQQSSQLRSLCVCVALNEEYRPLGVKTASHEQCVCRESILAELCRLLFNCYSVEVGNAVDAVILLLKRTPVSYSTDVVAESECACRLDSTENEFFIVHVETSLLVCSGLASFHIVLELAVSELVENALIENVNCALFGLRLGDNACGELYLVNAALCEDKDIVCSALRKVILLCLFSLWKKLTCVCNESMSSLYKVSVLL